MNEPVRRPACLRAPPTGELGLWLTLKLGAAVHTYALTKAKRAHDISAWRTMGRCRCTRVAAASGAARPAHAMLAPRLPPRIEHRSRETQVVALTCGRRRSLSGGGELTGGQLCGRRPGAAGQLAAGGFRCVTSILVLNGR